MKKTDLIHKLKQLQGISDDERAYLINLVNTKKKYGLVWEDKPEVVEEQLRENLPVLKEVNDRAIINGEEYPNHILIEGDNLHALTALTFTHEGKFDVIYIDPPYNTGNKDFKYNDTFVDKEDSFRHSKWISFIHKRLQIAKSLLKNNGVIFISIDDNEQGQLKMLADEIFTEKCHVATIPVVMNLKGNPDNYGFSDTHEYCLVYTKYEKACSFGSFGIDEEALEDEWDEDDHGLFKRADTLRRTGQDAARERRPKGWFPVFIDSENRVYITEDDSPKNPDDYILWPINEDGIELSWTWSKKKIKDEPHNLIVINGRNGKNVYKKQRPQLGDLPTKKPKSIFYKPEYSTSTSTTELKKMLGAKKFDAPKPVHFISDLIKIGGSDDSNVLDFFAGSGTTLHATMQLNKQDGGRRKCILVTNNENNICEEITYERNKRVIQGYTNTKGEEVEGLSGNNLRYFKSEFVGREPSVKNKKEITRLATELLCIKEDIYTEQKQIGDYQLNATYVRCFQQGSLYLLVIYDEDVIEQMVEVIQSVVEADADRNSHFKVYVFSNGQYPYTEEFEEVLPYITLCALPDAIYKAYQNVLPKRQRQQVPELEEPTAEEVEKSLEHDVKDVQDKQDKKQGNLFNT